MLAQMPHKPRKSTSLELVQVKCTKGDTAKYVSEIYDLTCEYIYRTYPSSFAPDTQWYIIAAIDEAVTERD